MTDPSKNDSPLNSPLNGRLLAENEVDQLLSTFYRMEVPQALNSLPSTWPELLHSPVEPQKPVELTVAPVARATGGERSVPAVSRGIAVAVATLAACMMLMVFSNFSAGPQPSGTAKSQVTPVDPDNQLMNVSAGDTNGALDENQTSLEEIDQIELSPVEPPTEPAVDLPVNNTPVATE